MNEFSSTKKSFSDNKISLKRRYAAEKRFRFYGMASIIISFSFLIILVYSIISKGIGAFWQTKISLPIEFSENVINPQKDAYSNSSALMFGNYSLIARQALARKLGVDTNNYSSMSKIDEMLSATVKVQLRDLLMKNPSLIGKTVEVLVLASANVDYAFKGEIDLSVPENRRKISNQQVEWIKKLVQEGCLSTYFNYDLFTGGASSRAEVAGVGVAIVGSLYMMLIIIILTLPIGIASAVYLEEFAQKNFLTTLIKVNINNLAAVPSIVYGLLGLAIFINLFGIPRSSPLVGGLVLALITLPNVIISASVALQAVPGSIRSAALGLGASKVQTVFHHVLPLAMPGILTGSIIGLSRAFGETAPLLLIGMVAFVTSYPKKITDPATALPVQIYLWTNEAERGFVERAFGGIIILIFLLVVINIAMVFLRKRFERRW
ncbi:Phosphate transport system permease protein PstA [Liberibacter crescens BT-1]|uniref:Phosphate transport system permease protein PstA n=1 Tax=Liberibacter crescens (strain BT-1) TaxID=1215343 RepID=L0EUM3_LIBCB|nr:phosphate ABC transporter permease PstA [Liberibacter crescens]AGA65254.1 Phosphate transport system permease protein PstA [Liberibacter crescens BT-1]AMC13192.1 phosphate ABC transporter permease [Liberibacter crescens]